MVFLALLRDPARLHRRTSSWVPAKLLGRAGDVRLDPAAVLPALARQVAGAFGATIGRSIKRFFWMLVADVADPRLIAAGAPAEEPYVDPSASSPRPIISRTS